MNDNRTPVDRSENDNRPRQATRAFLIDLVIVIAFVVIGRRNHDEGLSLGGLIGTLAPFLIALVLVWLLARIWREPISLRSGVIVWIGTIMLGMVLRRFAFDDGTATAFVIVATVFVGAFTNGWRTYARFRASS